METKQKPVKYCKECWNTICPFLVSQNCIKCQELNQEIKEVIK